MKKNDFLQQIRKEIPQETRIFVQHHADIVIRINQLLEDKGWTQKKLAESMDKRPSEISKWLNGEHNFTLRSLAKLEAELGESIINVPSNRSYVNTDGVNVSMTVHRNKPISYKESFEEFISEDSSVKQTSVA